MPKFIQNRSKWRPGALQRHPKIDSENNSFPNIPPGVFFLDFGRHLGDLGCHLVPSWAPTGSQYRPIRPPDAPKVDKMTFWKESYKKFKLLIEFWSVIGRLGGPRSSFLLQFCSVSVVLAYYEEIKNFMNIYAKMDPKSEPKIDVWPIRGATFEVLGAFLRSRIFDEFSIGKQISQKSDIWSLRGWKRRNPQAVGG